MKRIIVIIIALVVVVAGGVGAFWYVNQGKAREQIVLALQQLDRAGVSTSYDKLSITGFPLAYGGRFEKLKAEIPARGVTVDLPIATAGMSVTSIGTVEFELPESFLVTMTEGPMAGQQLQVESEALVARAAPAADKAYDVGLSADRLKLTPPDGAGEALELWNLAIEAALATEGPQGGKIDAQVSADSVIATAPAPNGAAKVNVDKLVGAFAGDLANLSATLSAERIAADAGDDGLASIDGLSVDVKVTPETQFDAALLFADDYPEGVTAQVVRAGLEAVARGGAFDGEIAFTNMNASLATELEGNKQAITIDSQNLRYGADVNPSLLGLGFAAEKLKIDVAGFEEFSYDVDDMEFGMSSVAGEAFDLSPMLDAPTPDIAMAMLVEMVHGEILRGGSVAFNFASSGYQSESALDLPSVPIDRLKARAGANRSTISLDADSADVDMSGESIVYELTGAGLNGAGTVNSVAMKVAVPLKASPETQQATLIYDIDTVTLDDQIWAMIDPENKLKREIRGLRIDTGLEVVVVQDVLSATPNLLAPPFEFGNVAVNQVLLDMFGFHGEASGAVAISPPPPTGEVIVTLRDWQAFLDSAAATPIGQDPQAQTMLLMASAWVEQFGQPGATPEITELKVELGEAGITVNGKPLQAEPAPEPQPQQ